MYWHTTLATVHLFAVVNLVLGQPTLTYDHGKNCDADLIMVCHFTGVFNPTDSRSWTYPYTMSTIMDAGTSIDPNKYTESITTSAFSYFTMTIKGVTLSDTIGAYTCEYQLVDSATVTLEYECYDDTVAVASDSISNMIIITVDRVYPDMHTTTLTVTLSNNAGTAIPGAVSSAPSTAYPDHFALTWTSTDVVNDGAYTYTVVIHTSAAGTPVTLADNIPMTFGGMV